MKKRVNPWARLKRSIAWKLMPDANLRMTVPGGVQFPITRKGDHIVFSEIVLRAIYAPFFALIPSLKSFVDLGCNCGFFTGALLVEAQKRGWDLDFGLLVDAERESVELARRFLELNQAGHFHAVQALIGQSGREEVFTVSQKSQCSSSKSVFEPTRRETMKARSLRELLAEQGRETADLLKVDIEGSEKELFDHEPDLLARFKYVLLEWHSPHITGPYVRDWIASHGVKSVLVQSVVPEPGKCEPFEAEIGLALWTNA